MRFLLRKWRYIKLTLWVWFKNKAKIILHKEASKRSSFKMNTVLILYEKQQGLCYYCSKKLSDLFLNGLNVTMDHIMPVSKGGKLSDITNLCITCHYCNKYKSDMLPDDFIELLQKNGGSMIAVASKGNVYKNKVIKSNITFINKKPSP